MRYIARHIIMLLAVALAVMPAGCVYDDSPAGCGDARRLQGEVPVRFTLKLDDKGMGSRADATSGVWNPDHEQVIGTRFDSQVSRLHVMLVDKDDKITHVELRKFMYVAEDEGYTFTGNIDFGDNGKEAGSYRVMLLANCGPAIMSATTLAELPSTIADVMWYSPNGSPRDGVLIPMWGVTTHDFTFTGDKDAPEEIGEIELLRAVAKVDIQLDPTKMEGYELVSAKINKTNSYINPFPKGWDAAGATTAQGLRHGAPFNPVKTEVTGHAFTPGKYIDEPAGDIVFYLPEFDSAEGEATIDVVLRHNATGQTLTYTEALHFDDKDVNKGATAGDERLATDIVRNHLYRFTIDGIHFGTLTYNVTCWEKVTSTIGWGVGSLDYEFKTEDNEGLYGYVAHPSYDDGKRIKYNYLNADNMVKTDGSFKNYMLTDKATNAEYFFTLRSPEGAVWKASLVNIDGTPYTGDHFEFAPGNLDSQNQRAVSTGIARKEPYSIAIRVTGTNTWGSAADATPVTADDYVNLNLGSATSLKAEDGLWYHIDDRKIVSKEDQTLDPYITPVQKFKLNENGENARSTGTVPEVYLIIRISLDGGDTFSEPLEINPLSDGTGNFGQYKLAGDATKIQLRHLFLPFSGVSNEELIKGKDGGLGNDAWWGLPMGHKDATTNP